MVLRKYGLELHSLTVDDLELVRKWRNDDFIQERMLLQDEISSEDQKRWFAQLDNSTIYLLIYHEGLKIGLVNVREINWEKRTGEAGIFIGDPNYRNSYIPMLVILCLMDVFFYEFEFSKLKAKVRADNSDALHFNRELGYTVESLGEEFINLVVNESGYTEHKEKLNPFLLKFDSDKLKHEFSQEEKDYLFPLK
ncbi:MAG: GNAT family N-acetyltransferase [Crocinitomicaceae bacterium]|nr:GNAT family N-acetyltransferase [Crocinitomicaceae bacterium]